MKTALVLGGGGFIGSHMVKRLKSEGFWVRAVDLKYPQYSDSPADDFVQGDLRDPVLCRYVIDRRFDEIYQYAADMGGAGYIFTGENDADIMHNSALVNINVLESCLKRNCRNIFYSSSACIYPEHSQLDPDNQGLREQDAYPAAPDSEYGWEKLFSERLYLSYARNYQFNVSIGRFHNIFGPEGVFDGGKEKSPAAICRKVAKAKSGESIEVWGDGEQTRSFLYIDECLEGTSRMFRQRVQGPLNIGSKERVTINELVRLVASIAGKEIHIKHIDGPLGVRGRNSDNTLIRASLGWEPTQPLKDGLEKTYNWIRSQIG